MQWFQSSALEGYFYVVFRDLERNRVACSGDSSGEVRAVVLAPNTFEVSAPRTCLGLPDAVRAYVQFQWDAPPRGGRIAIDRAPNQDPWSAWVSRP